VNMLDAIAPKSDQINAEDLVGRTITVTVKDVTIRGGQEQPISVALEETDKVFRPCKTTARLMVAGWGPDASKYAGNKMTLYRDPSVKWGGVATGGIRISHMSGLDAPLVMALAENKKNRKVHTVQPLQVQRPAAPVDVLSVDDARDLIANAVDMDALAAVWARADVAPHKRALKGELDARKLSLSPPPELTTVADLGGTE